MGNGIDIIRSENAGFYKKTDLLKNAAYLRELGWLNSFIGLIYIICSFGAASAVKHVVKTYRFVLQAGYEDLGGQEVLEWAARQARSTFFDGAEIAIAAFSVAMIVLVLWVSFVIPKYDLYKHQQRYLLGLVGLAAAQTACSVIPWPGSGVGWFSAGTVVFSWLLQVAVLLPQIFGSKMFYPLEFKSLSKGMERLNWAAEIFLKWLDKKNT